MFFSNHHQTPYLYQKKFKHDISSTRRATIAACYTSECWTMGTMCIVLDPVNPLKKLKTCWIILKDIWIRATPYELVCPIINGQPLIMYWYRTIFYYLNETSWFWTLENFLKFSFIELNMTPRYEPYVKE